jgi:hypothetical protein
MGNRPKYWCKRRVRLTSMSTGQVFAARFCAFASLHFFTKSLHKKLPVTWALVTNLTARKGQLSAFSYTDV